jgi:hypothetical protein
MKTNLTDSSHITEAFAALGYTPPSASWTRFDPRGSEYGKYGIHLDGNDEICVNYYPKDSSVAGFSFYFTTLASFENWTRNNF